VEPSAALSTPPVATADTIVPAGCRRGAMG